MNQMLDACLVILAILALALIVSAGSRRDDTDAAEGHRSGMRPHVDARTGCHYLSKPFGGITPRMGPDGKQICERVPTVTESGR